jgi:hypothetical protein
MTSDFLYSCFPDSNETNLIAIKPEKELGEEETRRIRAAVRMKLPAFLTE